MGMVEIRQLERREREKEREREREREIYRERERKRERDTVGGLDSHKEKNKKMERPRG